jgi:protein phosphatase
VAGDDDVDVDRGLSAATQHVVMATTDTLELRVEFAPRVVASAAWSARGPHRDTNEDSVLLAPPLLVVADGVGGRPGGEHASRLAVEALRLGMPSAPPDAPAAMRAALAEAHAAVRAGLPERMATTVVAAHIGEAGITVGHAGDSRAYLWRAGTLARLTADDSLVAALTERGDLDAAAARRHPLRSVIVRALGLSAELEAHVSLTPALPGDVLVLCSDGVSGPLGDERLGRLLAGADDLGLLVERLAFSALRAGGVDDISVLAARLG